MTKHGESTETSKPISGDNIMRRACLVATAMSKKLGDVVVHRQPMFPKRPDSRMLLLFEVGGKGYGYTSDWFKDGVSLKETAKYIYLDIVGKGKKK